MSLADSWEEVKKLAQDFQRAQLTSANQRLTERNCVEIVTKLIELKLLDVVFTSDGKEYVTPQQLNKEIQDELFVHGGRLSLQELAQYLNVSITVIEQRVHELIRGDKNAFFVLGQLVTSAYLDSLCEEFNEKLRQEGSISVSELSKTSDLPGDFLQQQVERRLGRIIHGKQDDQDPSVIYTEAFVRRNVCKIRGILSGVTKPTPIGNILSKFSNGQVPERLFFSIVDKLIKSKRIDGVLSGTANRTSYFIPNSYSRAQSQWIEGFMNGNGYVDLDAAARLGISDPRAYISKLYPGSVFLKSYCLGETIYKQVKEFIEENLESVGWVDVVSSLPLSIANEDVRRLLDLVMPSVTDAHIFDSVIVNRNLIKNLRSSFKTLMEEKAVKEIQSGQYIQMMNEIRAAEKKARVAELNAEVDGGRNSKKEDRKKKAAGGKAGGGTQGRETKTKSTKKKYLAGKKDGFDSDSEDEKPKKQSHGQQQSHQSGGGGGASKPVMKVMPFLSIPEIRKQLKNAEVLNEAPEELIDTLASYLVKFLTEDYQQELKEEFERFMADKCGRKSREEVHQKLLKMMVLLQFYNDGLSHFEGDVKNQLEKHLLRTYGQEVIGAATQYALIEAGLDESSNVLDLPNGQVKESLIDLGKSAAMQSFIESMNIILPTKKSASLQLDRMSLLHEAREALTAEMESAQDSEPALYLHVATLILFSFATESLLQASGKFVPQIIGLLQSKLSNEEYLLLKGYQEAVVQFIKSKGNAGEETLKEMYPNLKVLVHTKSKEASAQSVKQ